MTLDEAKAAAKACEGRILDADYYLDLWRKANRLHPAIVDSSTVREALGRFQDFWEALPDARAIRREPFFEVCSLAETYMETFGGDDAE